MPRVVLLLYPVPSTTGNYIIFTMASGDLRHFFGGGQASNNPVATAVSAQSASRLKALMGNPSAFKPADNDDAMDADSLSGLSVSSSRKRGRGGGARSVDDDVIGVLDEDSGQSILRGTGAKRPRTSRNSSSSLSSSMSRFPIVRNTSSASSEPTTGTNRRTSGGGTTSSGKFEGGDSDGYTRYTGTNHSSFARDAETRRNKRNSSSGRGNGGAISASKMGPWGKRPVEEEAVCTEDGYDPLELLDDANRELFGNNAFRGIQEDVSTSKFVNSCGHSCFATMDGCQARYVARYSVVNTGPNNMLLVHRCKFTVGDARAPAIG